MSDKDILDINLNLDLLIDRVEIIEEHIKALERSKELVLSYRELSKRECDGRIQEVKKELKELEKKLNNTYNLALEADANTNRLDQEIEKLKNK